MVVTKSTEMMPTWPVVFSSPAPSQVLREHCGVSPDIPVHHQYALHNFQLPAGLAPRVDQWCPPPLPQALHTANS